MKDCSWVSLEASRPDNTALEAVNFCLQQLYDDKTKNINDEVVSRLKYDELIGALLAARDELEAAAEAFEV